MDFLIFLAKLCPSLPIIWNLARNIKESIYIRVKNPTLNNNIGKFNLPHKWTRSYLTLKVLIEKGKLTIITPNLINLIHYLTIFIKLKN